MCAEYTDFVCKVYRSLKFLLPIGWDMSDICCTISGTSIFLNVLNTNNKFRRALHISVLLFLQVIIVNKTSYVGCGKTNFLVLNANKTKVFLQTVYFL